MEAWREFVQKRWNPEARYLNLDVSFYLVGFLGLLYLLPIVLYAPYVLTCTSLVND